jgi:hypothetical protein
MLCGLGWILKAAWDGKKFMADQVGEHLERIVKKSAEWREKAGYD